MDGLALPPIAAAIDLACYPIAPLAGGAAQRLARDCVTPIAGETLRLIALLGFDTKPGAMSSERLKKNPLRLDRAFAAGLGRGRRHRMWFPQRRDERVAPRRHGVFVQNLHHRRPPGAALL